ncbi:type II toxin-antitoxin system RelE/ParE family toxin [Salinimicrobium sp. GXAS 041]|uniref:type II toxin-antitoxin system RelE/ParE family toxin n=1 Tax=Salinimicrobium sp. GXAS 041 TaxID=3400806 RepID=UPI003C7711AD
MSNHKYLISRQAIKDLEKIWHYTVQKWSIEQADRYYNLIIEEILFVADNFMIGKSIDHIRKGYRVTKVKTHLIFYRKSEDGIIQIIRILHQRMNLKNRLK